MKGMSDRKLRPNFQRLDDQITGNVVDAIMISPRSSGRLSLPGQFSQENPPPAHKVETASTGPGVDYEQVLLGSAEKYVVVYEVQNHRDSLSFAHIEVTSS
jgi:hypothetical protein